MDDCAVRRIAIHKRKPTRGGDRRNREARIKSMGDREKAKHLKVYLQDHYAGAVNAEVTRPPERDLSWQSARRIFQRAAGRHRGRPQATTQTSCRRSVWRKAACATL